MFGHQKNVWRFALLLGLVVAFLGVAGGAWAADAMSLDERLAFPFLSVKAEQVQMLANSFSFQMNLFLGVAGEKGADGGEGFASIRILALLATLIGAIMILFFPKYQKPSVLLTWFLLVVIVIFVPLGSKMIFYPIKVFESPSMMGASERTDLLHQGDDCSRTPAGCGFTPQLLAVHIGSTLQVIASDLFRSKEWMGLIDRQTAATELYMRPDFNLGKQWIDLNKDYADRGCELPVKSLLPNSNVTTSDEEKAGNQQPFTLMQAWDEIGKGLTTGEDGQYPLPPPMIVFPRTADDVKDWSPAQIDAYLAGLKLICTQQCSQDIKDKLVSGAGLTMGGGAAPSTGTGGTTAPAATESVVRLTATDVIDDISAHGTIFADSYSKAAASLGPVQFGTHMELGPGMYFAPISAFQAQGGSSTGGGSGGTDDRTWWSVLTSFGTQGVPQSTGGQASGDGKVALAKVARTCFIAQTSYSGFFKNWHAEDPAICLADKMGAAAVTGIADAYTPANVAKTYQDYDKMYLQANANVANDLDIHWKSILQQMQQVPKVQNMPVKMAIFKAPSQKTEKYPAPTVRIVNAPGCYELGEQIVDFAINALDTKQPRSSDQVNSQVFDRLIPVLRGEGDSSGVLSQLPGTMLTPKDLSSLGEYPRKFSHDDPEKYALVSMMAVRMNEAMRRLNVGVDEGGNDPDSRDERSDRNTTIRTALVNSVIELMQRVTMQSNGIHDLGALQNAATDGVSINPKLVGFGKMNDVLPGQDSGNWLADKFSGFAFNIGKVFAFFGALVTGPLAMAYVKFLDVLVDFTLMTLITLTPILFLFGLMMPTAAAGVMTTAIMSVLVLKIVPVTLIILNGVAGMIYDLLPGSVGINADFTRNLLIIAMGALYTNLVGLTFFLMFKMGDPAAVLGRLTALDSSAKQLADRGIAAATAIAGAAGLLVAGGIGGLFGSAFAGYAKNKAYDKLGVGEYVRAGRAMKGTKNTDGSNGDNEANRQAALKGGAEDVSKDGANPAIDGAKENFTDRDGNSLGPDDQMRAFFGENGEGGKRIQKIGERGLVMTDGEAREMARYGSVTTNDGKSYHFDEHGQIQDGLPPEIPGGDIDASGSNILGAGGGGRGGPVNFGGGGGALNVRVVGGSLETVGQVQSLQEVTGSPDQVSDRVEKLQQEKTAQGIVERTDRLDKLIASGQLTDDGVKKAEDVRNALASSKSQADLIEADRMMSSLLSEKGMTIASFDKIADRNMNQQVADELVRVKDLLDGGTLSAKDEETYKKYQKKLLGMETAGLAQAEMAVEYQKANQEFHRLKSAADVIGAADRYPGMVKSTLSGVYGAFTGLTGGGSKIPVLGPMLGEVMNEFYQAPERARAWNAAGGFGSWWSAQGKAQRLGFYQKEMAPIAAGHQYDMMNSGNGAFQAQADLARQTASEAVARSRSQYEALIAHSKTAPANIRVDSTGNILANLNPESINFRNFMTSTELTGLGRIEAADKIVSVRQEAFLMREKPLQVARSKGGLADGKLLKSVEVELDGNKTGQMLQVETEKVNVALTAEMLNRFRGDMATKKTAGSFDDMMRDHYGLAEKQYLRGDAEWNKTRYMNQSSAAAAAFSRNDISTDYLVAGHLKMVQGKEKFKELSGQYNVLLEYRNETNALVARELQSFMKGVGGTMQDALKKADIGMEKFQFSNGQLMTGVDLQVQQRSQLEKHARDELKKRGVFMPLEAIFDGAEAKGYGSYLKKARKAIYEAQELESEAFVDMQKAAGSMYSSRLDKVKNFSKKIEIERDGTKWGLGQADQRLFEKLFNVFGTRVTEVDKMLTEYMKEHQDAMKVTLDKNLGTASMHIQEKEWNEFFGKLEKYDKGLADKFMADNGKNFRRMADGSMQFGALDVGKAKGNGKLDPDTAEY